MLQNILGSKVLLFTNAISYNKSISQLVRHMQDNSQAYSFYQLAAINTPIKALHSTLSLNKTNTILRPQTTLPTHPAIKQLSIHAKHMHSDAQLSFLDTRTCIQALCTTGSVPGWTCTSAIAAPTSALLLRLHQCCPACEQLLMHGMHWHGDAQMPFLDTRTCVHASALLGTYRGRDACQHRRPRSSCAGDHTAVASCMQTIIYKWQ